MRFRAMAARVLILFAALLAAWTEGALCQDKGVTPPSGGLPAIGVFKMLDVGAVAPDFSIRDTEGVPYRLADELGKKNVLIVFWSIFCEPCRTEMPVIQKLYDRYKDHGLSVVCIALDGEALQSSIAGVVKQEGYTFRVLIDEINSRETFKVADPYGVEFTPTMYLLDKAGKVALARAGRPKEEELAKAIQSLTKK